MLCTANPIRRGRRSFSSVPKQGREEDTGWKCHLCKVTMKQFSPPRSMKEDQDAQPVCKDSFHLHLRDRGDIWPPMCQYLAPSSKHTWKSCRSLTLLCLFANAAPWVLSPDLLSPTHPSAFNGEHRMIFPSSAWVWPHFPLPGKKARVHRNISQ